MVDGLVRLDATLDDAPDSEAAQDTVADAADGGARRPIPTRWSAARRRATWTPRDSAARDLRVIVPLVLLVISVVLALLLRSLLAPLLLVATVVLSVCATVGVGRAGLRAPLRVPGQRSADPADRVRVPRRPGDRLQHLPDDPGPGGVGPARHQGRRPAGARGHRRRDHQRRAGAGGDLRGARRAPAGDPRRSSASWSASASCSTPSSCARCWCPPRSRSIGDRIWWPSALAKGPTAASPSASGSPRRSDHRLRVGPGGLSARVPRTEAMINA